MSSTHPRDFPRVLDLSKELPLQVRLQQRQQIPGDNDNDSEPANSNKIHIIPGFGIHPWWVNKLTDYDWEEAVVPAFEGAQQQQQHGRQSLSSTADNESTTTTTTTMKTMIIEYHYNIIAVKHNQDG